MSIDYAAKFAGLNTLVILFHVIEEIDHLDDREDVAFYEKLKALAKEKMDKLVEETQSKGLRVRPKIVVGKRALRIITYAADHEVDLIVMSSHKMDWGQPTKGFSTISHQVAVMGKCPILLVK